jgi:NodT family efflux transporter outer membrane factor (OMF) lipoprotein
MSSEKKNLPPLPISVQGGGKPPVKRFFRLTRSFFSRGASRRPAASVFGLLVLLTAGCAVGPDFVRPKPPQVRNYTGNPAPEETATGAGQAQRFEMGEKIVEEWWRLFNSPELDAVVRKAVDENQTLQSALARLRQSRENLRAGYGVFFPQIDSSFGAVRQKFTPTQFGFTGIGSSTFNLYTFNNTVSYVVDVFGGERRQVESLAAQAEYQKQNARAAYLTLVGNVANTAIAGAAYRAEIQATEQIIGFEEQQLRITENQVRAGTVPFSNVLAVRAQLEASEATLPPLQKSLSQTEHLLSALVGKTPEQWAPPPFDLAGFTLPVQIPLSLPSELTRLRPDIVAAEAQLHAASANVGVATAAMLPHLTLSGNYGWDSTAITTLLGPGSNFWLMGANLAAPIFHGGTLWFQRRAAIEAYQAALSDYRQSVVAGFQQVADSLRALEADAHAVEAQYESLETAKRNMELVRVNHEAELVNYLQVLSAGIQYQQARLGFVQARALRLQDTTALFLALGGGWWEPQEAVPAESENNVLPKFHKPDEIK